MTAPQHDHAEAAPAPSVSNHAVERAPEPRNDYRAEEVHNVGSAPQATADRGASENGSQPPAPPSQREEPQPRVATESLTTPPPVAAPAPTTEIAAPRSDRDERSAG